MQGAREAPGEVWTAHKPLQLMFLAWVLVSLYLSYPLALLPHGLDPDSPWLRLGAIGVTLLSGALLIYLASNRSARWWRLTIVLALAIGIALLPSGLRGFAQYFRLPTMAIASVLALLCIVSRRFRAPTWFTAAVLIYGLWAIGQVCRTPLNPFFLSNHMEEVFLGLGLITVPLASCLLIRPGSKPAALLTRSMVLLWCLQVVLGLVEFAQGWDVTGTSLNRNWMATSLLATAPWVLLLIAKRPWPSRIQQAGMGGVVLVTLFLVYHCHSRGAWLALICYGGLALAWRMTWRQRGLAMVTIVILLTLASWRFYPKLAEINARDVRLPIWSACLVMIADHPLTGIGPLDYAQAQIGYLSESSFHNRPTATSYVEHPHNELLYRSVALGLPAGLALIVLWLPSLRDFRRESGWLQVAQCSAILVLVHSMFDKVLVQPPTDIIGLFCLGFCYHGLVKSPSADHGEPAPGWALKLCGALLLAWATALLIQQTIFEWHYRRGQQYSAAKQYEIALDHYRTCQRIDPAETAGHYAVGSVSVQQTRDLNRGLDALRKVKELNPYYDHVNRLLGRLFLAAGRPADALPALQLDAQLYPMDISTLQLLYLTRYELGEDEQLPPLSQRMQEVLHHWGAFDRHRLQAATEAWQLSVGSQSPAAAVQAAEELIGVLGSRHHAVDFIDPYLELFTRQSRWPEEVVFGGFGPHDVDYWLDLLDRREQVAALPSPSLPEAVLAVVELVHEQVGLDEDLSFTSPSDTWDRKAGTPLARAVLISWLLAGQGIDTALVIPLEESSPWQWLFMVEGQLWACSALETTRIMPHSEAARKLEQQNIVLYDAPMAFLGRHYVLGNLVAASESGDWHFAQFPSARAASWAQHLKKVGLEVAPRDLHLRAPLRQP